MLSSDTAGLLAPPKLQAGDGLHDCLDLSVRQRRATPRAVPDAHKLEDDPRIDKSPQQVADQPCDAVVSPALADPLLHEADPLGGWRGVGAVIGGLGDQADQLLALSTDHRYSRPVL